MLMDGSAINLMRAKVENGMPLGFGELSLLLNTMIKYRNALKEINKIEPDEKSDGTILGGLVHDADEMSRIAGEALK